MIPLLLLKLFFMKVSVPMKSFLGFFFSSEIPDNLVFSRNPSLRWRKSVSMRLLPRPMSGCLTARFCTGDCRRDNSLRQKRMKLRSSRSDAKSCDEKPSNSS